MRDLTPSSLTLRDVAEYEARGPARIVLPGWIVVGLIPVLATLLVLPWFFSDAWWAIGLVVVGVTLAVAGLTFRKRP